MSNDGTFTECKIVNPSEINHAFAVTVTYDTESGTILTTDYEPVLRTNPSHE